MGSPGGATDSQSDHGTGTGSGAGNAINGMVNDGDTVGSMAYQSESDEAQLVEIIYARDLPRFLPPQTGLTHTFHRDDVIFSIYDWASSLFTDSADDSVSLLWAWDPSIQVFDLPGDTIISDAGFGASVQLYLVRDFWLTAQLALKDVTTAPPLEANAVDLRVAGTQARGTRRENILNVIQ